MAKTGSKPNTKRPNKKTAPTLKTANSPGTPAKPTQRMKKVKVEYRLLINHHTDPRSGAKQIRFLLVTVKEFVSFQYHLRVDFSQQGGHFTLKILGLYAPVNLMPGMGPAVFETFIPLVSGKFSVTVVDMDKKKATFDFQIRPDAVVVLKSDPKAFLYFNE